MEHLCNSEKKTNCSRCNSCTEYNENCSYEITQKRIWKQVRTYSSLFTMAKSSANVTSSNNLPMPTFANVNWNQSSDRNHYSIQNLIVPSRGNSTKHSITRERPGSCSTGGKGVDIKHNSYNRYLNRCKSKLVRNQCTIKDIPIHGNKKQTFGLLSQSRNCCKCLN